MIWLGLSMRHEALSPERDVHGRVPPEANLFSPPDLRETPWVDRAVEALRARLLGAVEAPAEATKESRRAQASFRMTFDVDALAAFPGWRSVARSVLRSGPRAAAEAAGIALGRRADPFLAAHEAFAEALRERGLASTWHWIAARRSRLDPPAYLASERFRRALRALRATGAEHGLHPSYRAGERAEWIAQEKQALERALDAPVEAARMHYLRWDWAATPRLLAEAGLKTDSTLGFAQFGGYRAGTARPFELIDHAALKPVGLTEIPLAALDSAHLFYEREPLETFAPAAARVLGGSVPPGAAAPASVSSCAILLHAHNFAGREAEILRAVAALAEAGAERRGAP